MKKNRLFENIQEGEVLRLLRAETTREGTRYYWSFGIVGPPCYKHFIDIQMPTWRGIQYFKVRKDGMDQSGKNARQVAFQLTEEEKENPIIKEFHSILMCRRYQHKQIKNISHLISSGEINMFPEAPLPEV